MSRKDVRDALIRFGIDVCRRVGGENNRAIGKVLIALHYIVPLSIIVLFFTVEALRWFLLWIVIMVVASNLVFGCCLLTKMEQHFTGQRDFTAIDPILGVLGLPVTNRVRYWGTVGLGSVGVFGMILLC